MARSAFKELDEFQDRGLARQGLSRKRLYRIPGKYDDLNKQLSELGKKETESNLTFEREKKLRGIPQATEASALKEKEMAAERESEDRIFRAAFGATESEIGGRLQEEIEHPRNVEVQTSTGTRLKEAALKYKPYAQRLLEKKIESKFKPEDVSKEESKQDFKVLQEMSDNQRNRIKSLQDQIYFEESRKGVSDEQRELNVSNLRDTLGRENTELKRIDTLLRQKFPIKVNEPRTPTPAPEKPIIQEGLPDPAKYKEGSILKDRGTPTHRLIRGQWTPIK